ncbi:MAG: hypothetical protein HFI04_10780 [Lachnospiraceae bacterium]|nr:hypothetical protein [Lachnospiraceae bacterium]
MTGKGKKTGSTEINFYQRHREAAGTGRRSQGLAGAGFLPELSIRFH